MKTDTLPPFSWEEIQLKLGLKPLAERKLAHFPRQTGTYPSHSVPDLMQQQCQDGERTAHLTRLAGALLAAGHGEAGCIEQCLAWNSRNLEPLDEDKIISTCESISATDQRNHPERYADLQPAVPLFDLAQGRIDRFLTTNPPARRWLIKDLVVLGKAGAVVAPGGSSKSQWLLQLAVGVATDIKVAEHWEVGEPGSVLAFFAEDDIDEIHRRLKRIKDHLVQMGHAKALIDIEERLYVFSTIGTDTLLTKRGPNGEVSATGIVRRMSALAAQIPNLRLIVIDPASRFRGGAENSNEDTTRFVEAVEALASETGASVLLAHHTNKGSYAADADPGQGASRGASALTDGLRWQMNLNRPTDRQMAAIGMPRELAGQYVAATVTKTNYSAIPQPVLLERCHDGYLTVVSPEHAKARLEQDAIVRVLRALNDHQKPISARELEDRFGGIDKTLKMSKQRVRDVVRLGIEKMQIAGGERKPLVITDLGAGILKSYSSAELATRGANLPPHKKSQ